MAVRTRRGRNKSMGDYDRTRLLKDAAQRAIRYLDGVQYRSVAPTPESVAALEALDMALPQHGATDYEVLQALDELGSPASMVTNGPFRPVGNCGAGTRSPGGWHIRG